MQQPCGLICHYYSLLSLSIQLTEVRVVYRGATIMSGLLPKDREAGESRNLTSAWSRLESSALPFSNYGNLGNLLTYLSLNVINWKIRTPSPILGSCWHSIIKPQLWHFCTKVWALQAPVRGALLFTLFYTGGNRSSKEECPKELTSDESLSGDSNLSSDSGVG